MSAFTATPVSPAFESTEPKVARVLLADSDLASRLALKSILSAAGYAVSGAATSAEAIGKLDENEFQLVLADLRLESADAGPELLAYARQKEFRPATALISADLLDSEAAAQPTADSSANRVVTMSDDDVSELLDQVAGLIGQRADRRIRRSLLSSRGLARAADAGSQN